MDIRYDAITKKCDFAKKTRENWLMSDYETSFAFIFNMLTLCQFKSRANIRGNMTKPLKSAVIMVANVYFEEGCLIIPQWTQNIKPNGEIVDFKLVHDQEGLIGFFGDFMVQDNVLTIFTELVRLIAAPAAHIPEIQRTFLTAQVPLLRMRASVAVQAEMAVQGLQGLAFNNEALPSVPPPQVPPPQVPPPQVPIAADEALREAFQNVCRTVNMLKCANTLRVNYQVMFSDIWNADETNTDLQKIKIFLALMLTYFRVGALTTVRDDWFAPIPPDASFEAFVRDFDASRWCAVSGASYIANVKDESIRFGNMISGGDYSALMTEINELNNRWGFRYGVKCLSFRHSDDCRYELNGKRAGRVAYYVNDIRKIGSEIFGEPMQDRTMIIYRICTDNPHSIKNAVTFYTDENLMALPPSSFVKVGDVGFDTCELAMMIVSAGGKNEHMGLPDFPDKGKIWRDNNDLFNIFSKIYNVCALDSDASREMNAGIAAMMNMSAADLAANIPEASSTGLQIFLAVRLQHMLDEALKYTEKFYAFIAVIYVIHRRKLEKSAQFKLLLKDINLLHLVGFLGWIMMSDNVISFSEDADDFKVTNTCKNIFEKYVLRLHEDEVPDEKYYYCNNTNTYTPTFDQKNIIKTLKELSLSVQSLEGILNSHACLHGIGFNLVKLYLETLKDLRSSVESGIIKGDEVPAYLDRQRLLPMSMFKRVGEGSVYVWAVKSFKKGPRLLDESVSYDYMSSNRNFNYKVCSADIDTGLSGWCADIIVQPNQESMGFSGQAFYEKRSYSGNDREVIVRNTASDGVSAFLTDHNNDYDVTEMMRATDLFMQHREEHFRIYARYTVDFGHMLHEYYEKGLLDEYGQYKFTDAQEKPWVTHTPYADMPADDKLNDAESVKNYLYSELAVRTMYGEEEELEEEFIEKFSTHLNVNSAVARDFEYDPETKRLIKKSQLTFFHDLLGKSPELYDNKIRNGESSVFGLFKAGDQFVGDVLLSALRSGEDTTKEVGRYKSFNQAIIKKGMMSQVLMKIMDHDALSPFYLYTNDDNNDNDEDNYRTQQAAVSKFLFYLNFETIGIAGNETSKQLAMKSSMASVYYMIVWSVIQVLVLPTYATMPAYSTYRGELLTEYLMSPSKLMASFDDGPLEGGISDEGHKERIRVIRKELTFGLARFLSMFFYPDIPATYNYSIVKLVAFQPLLEDLTRYISRGQELQDIKDIIKRVKDDQYNLCHLYCEVDEAPGALFPGEPSSIFDSTAFMCELVDMTLKYNVVKTIAMPLNSLNIFNKLSMLTPKSYSLEEDSDAMIGNLVGLCRSPVSIQSLIDKNVTQQLTGTDAPTVAYINKKRIEVFYENLLEVMKLARQEELVANPQWNPFDVAASVMCIRAYENTHIYAD
jgi:hypothetical protein